MCFMEKYEINFLHKYDSTGHTYEFAMNSSLLAVSPLRWTGLWPTYVLKQLKTSTALWIALHDSAHGFPPD